MIVTNINEFFKENNLPVAIVLTSTKWDEPPRMRHHVTQQLVRWYNVIFIEFFPNGKAENESFIKVDDRLLIYKVGRNYRGFPRIYANVPFYHHLVNKRTSKKIIKTLNSINNPNLLLFNFIYDFYEIYEFQNFKFTSYFCYDEFPKMRRSLHNKFFFKRFWQELIMQNYENKVATSSMMSFTPHSLLKEKLERIGCDVELLFHAHNVILPNKLEFDPHVKRLQNLIKVCFLGFIHYRLNKKLLNLIADRNDMQLFFAGPIDDDFSTEELMSRSNVYFTGVLKEDKILNYLESMDVLIIPYHEHLPENISLTTTSKLFQYVSSLKPIVITNLVNFIDLPKGVVYKSHDNDDFIKNIYKSYNEDSLVLKEVRRKVALENTWIERGNQLHEWITKKYVG